MKETFKFIKKIIKTDTELIIELRNFNMLFDFKIKIVLVILFSLYAGCTIFMINMGFIPLDMLFIEISDSLFLATIVFVIINKKEIVKESNKK